MLGRNSLALLLTVIAVGVQGCALVGLTILGTGASVAAGAGTQYTLDGIAYRTFSVPADDMRRATLGAFRRMDIAVQRDEASDEGRAIVGAAGDRTVEITLERLTARATRMRVTAKQGWFWRDRATAGEVIAQTAQSLDAASAVRPKPQ